MKKKFGIVDQHYLSHNGTLRDDNIKNSLFAKIERTQTLKSVSSLTHLREI